VGRKGIKNLRIYFNIKKHRKGGEMGLIGY
jgi:hypothetical protein